MVRAGSRGPLTGSKRGSRASGLGTATTARRRDTAFFDERSAGACFEEREKSRLSSFPALRSAASALGDDGRAPALLRLGWLRLSWARARAPKEMVRKSCSLGAESSFESSFWACLSVYAGYERR